MIQPKPQRILDPLHQLIDFERNEFEQALWSVIQTPPFQRLRRIRQLGFSEFVFPGATHTRFAHSIGVFHLARQLMKIIQRHIEMNNSTPSEHKMHTAIAAALVHDVGHGMFSHAFEDACAKLDLSVTRHEQISDQLIRNSEISNAFSKLGSGFANDVADVIGLEQPTNLYHSVVSSQFDADRLDYMQRDRLMSGVQSSGIDIGWLMANLEVRSVQFGTDEESIGNLDALILGPKSYQAAEGYVLSLFQLYPTLYFHKTTRSAEKLFSLLIQEIFTLTRSGHSCKTGLPTKHPLIEFANQPDNIDFLQKLDDLVFWGALPLLMDAESQRISVPATRLYYRRLPKCIDIRRCIEDHKYQPYKFSAADRKQYRAEVKVTCDKIVKCVRERQTENQDGSLPILIDEAARQPYKTFQDSGSPLNQILIRPGQGDGDCVVDMAELSPVVASAERYDICRAYVSEDDTDARQMLENIIRTEMQG